MRYLEPTQAHLGRGQCAFPDRLSHSYHIQPPLPPTVCLSESSSGSCFRNITPVLCLSFIVLQKNDIKGPTGLNEAGTSNYLRLGAVVAESSCQRCETLRDSVISVRLHSVRNMNDVIIGVENYCAALMSFVGMNVLTLKSH